MEALEVEKLCRGRTVGKGKGFYNTPIRFIFFPFAVYLKI